MKRELVVAVGLVLIASTVTAVVGHANPAGPVYTVAQVQSGLYRNPQAWAGRTVRVRAQMETLGGGMGRRSPFQAARRFMTIC